MQREIKFRGKTIQCGKWVCGSLLVDWAGTCQIWEKEMDGSVHNYIVHPETVGQFTSLIDKNIVEIYEGDYLVDRYPVDDEDLDAGYHESLLPVVWCSETLQWCVDASFAKDGSYLTSLVEYFENQFEVKGNIYEPIKSI